MTKATELAQLGGLVNVTGSGTATKVGIGTTVDISGGLSIKGTPIISNTGVWQGSTAGIQGAQGTNGVQGITGTLGTTGAQGTTGTQGASGSTVGGTANQVVYKNGSNVTSGDAGFTFNDSTDTIQIGSQHRFGLGSFTSAQRDALTSVTAGTIVWNADANQVQVYAGSAQGWKWIAELIPKATGGNAIYNYNGKIIHVFTSTGTFTVTNPSLTSIEVLVIGGGGAGGGPPAGDFGFSGGGAGGFRNLSGVPISATPGVYTVTVGAGAASRLSANGSDSSIGSVVVATGGGSGGASPSPVIFGRPGGSGGGGTPGGSSVVSPDGRSPTTQGNAGGSHGPANGPAGGGGAGGAGAIGNDPGPWPSVYAGGGGLGAQIPSTFQNPNYPYGTIGPGGSSWWVAGGGGGARPSGAGNPGYNYGRGGYGPAGNGNLFSAPTPIGYSGGGNGAPYGSLAGDNGISNTGGGGGGGSSGGAGGSGIVMIAYAP